jgi:putative membrane protein
MFVPAKEDITLRMSEPANPQSEERPDARLREAMETTLLAWLRTGLGLMGFGFVLARFGLFLQELTGTRPANNQHSHISLWFGILLVVLGTAVNLVAVRLYTPFLIKTRKGETDLPPTWRLALGRAYATAGIGIAMILMLVLMEFND